MGFKTEQLERNLKMLTMLPSLQYRKRADKVTPLFTPEQVTDIESVLVEDCGILIVEFEDDLKKMTDKRNKAAALAGVTPSAEPMAATPAVEAVEKPAEKPVEEPKENAPGAI